MHADSANSEIRDNNKRGNIFSSAVQFKNKKKKERKVIVTSSRSVIYSSALKKDIHKRGGNMKSKFYRFAFVLLAMICMSKLSQSARILVILPIPFKEHQTVYQPLIEHLHKQSHEIKVMTTNPIFGSRDGVTFDNITEIDLSFVYNLDILDELKEIDLEGSDMLKTIFNVMRKIYEAELRSPKVQELLNSQHEHFDLVLVDWSGSSSLMNIFAHRFNAPLVAITNGEAFPNAHEAFGNPSHPVAFPSVFLPFSENLNLIQRVSSVLSTIWYR